MNSDDQEEYYEEYHEDSMAKQARINAAAEVFAQGKSIRRLNEKDAEHPAASLNIKSQIINPRGNPTDPNIGFDAIHELFREHYDKAVDAYEAARPLSDDLRNDFLMNNEGFKKDLANTIPHVQAMLSILQNHTQRGRETRRILIKDMEKYIHATQDLLGIESGLAMRGVER